VSLSPATFASPTEPATYAWEATDEAVAARYGLPLERVVRFDLNTSPTTPSFVAGILAAGGFQPPLHDYPPGDYRALTEAAAEAYGVEPAEILVGAGADEVLDIAVKALLPPGGRVVLPAPSYAMYRVLTEGRPGRLTAVDRRPAAAGYTLDTDATRTAAVDADLVWLCSPNNPTGLAEPDGAIAALLDDLAADAAGRGREPPAVVLDEAYAEFAGSGLLPLRSRYPALVLVRTMSKAYGLAGFRVGFAIGSAETIARLARFRPPGSVSTVSATVATEALRRPDDMRANVAAILAERERLSAALSEAGWRVGRSATNFLLVDFADPARAAAVAEAMLGVGLVPRTFGAGHPLASHLRITVRTPGEDDRLIELAAGLAREAT
jgi:histidinol-phosphate aminotransferase